MFEIIVFLFISLIVVLVIRLLGAWMLRIDEVISNQKATISIMKELNNNIERLHSSKNEFENEQIENNKLKLIADLEKKFNNNEISDSDFQNAKKSILNLYI